MAQNPQENCIFCKIVEGEIPSKKVLEDDDFLAILDINPALPGHTLILPKNHYFVTQQMPADEGGKLGVMIKKVSQKLLKSLDVTGTSVYIANGGAAGQKVPHAMAHVIPRKKDDGVGLTPSFNDDFAGKQQEILSKMKAAINPGAASPQKPKPKPTQSKQTDDVDLDKISRMFD